MRAHHLLVLAVPVKAVRKLVSMSHIVVGDGVLRRPIRGRRIIEHGRLDAQPVVVVQHCVHRVRRIWIRMHQN